MLATANGVPILATASSGPMLDTWIQYLGVSQQRYFGKRKSKI